MKFDGKGFANRIEEQVKERVRHLGRKPKIVSFLVGEDPASALYTKLKQQAAERVGIEFEVVKLEQIERDQITKIAENKDVTGIMVQLPVPGVTDFELAGLLSAIPLNKDVDGLRYPESGVVPPVVTAVMKILTEMEKSAPDLWSKRMAVVGARGTVGSGIVEQLEKRQVEVIRVGRERTAEKVQQGEVVISCVGKEGLIEGEMVQDGVVVIDVGAPRGDMIREVYQKASISVEVPGGVGPVTIACLMEKVLDLG